MNTPGDKTLKNKSQSIAHAIAPRKRNAKYTFQLADNRPESVVQRKLQEMINNSPQVKQATQSQIVADNYSTQQKSIQKKKNNTGLPDNLKSGIENLSGYSMDNVTVHYNSDKPEQLQAHAYAQGTDIHLGPGQEKHLPHEAWHVVQQKQGRVKPTIQMKGKVNINADVSLEKEASIMGTAASSLGASVQKKENKIIETAHPRVSGLKPLNVGNSLNMDVIQKADSTDVPVWGGTFTCEAYEPREESYDGKSIGANIRIIFTPTKNCPKNVTIGLIQIVRHSSGAEPSGELHQRLLEQSEPWAIDRFRDSNPVYGSYDDDYNSRATSLLDNPPDPREGNQFGMKTKRGKRGQPALLEDTPVLPLRKDLKQGQYFETTAVVLEGPKIGLCLGTVGWGWTKPKGQSKAVCKDFRLIQNSGPSENFEQAKEAWNNLADQEELVPIPDLLAAPAPPDRKKCFITTACTQYMGLKDDCEELQLLRQFRDSYLLKKSNGKNLINLYYEHAPQILSIIGQREDEEEILKRLYGIIKQCVNAIKQGDNEFAYQTYCKMMISLSKEFIPKTIISNQEILNLIDT